jgi:hypothetical protein
VRPSTSFMSGGLSFLLINTRRDPIGHRPIPKEKGAAAGWDTLVVEETMHPFLAYLAASVNGEAPCSRPMGSLPSLGLLGKACPAGSLLIRSWKIAMLSLYPSGRKHVRICPRCRSR